MISVIFVVGVVATVRITVLTEVDCTFDLVEEGQDKKGLPSIRSPYNVSCSTKC
jgi:hypothetical protein